MLFLIRKLKEKRSAAEGFEICVSVLVICVMLSVIMTVFSGVFKAVQLQEAAGVIIAKASVCGGMTEEVIDELQRQADSTGLELTAAWDAPDGWYSQPNGQVQYGDDISVTVSAKVYLSFFGHDLIPIELSAKRTGRSNVYWK